MPTCPVADSRFVKVGRLISLFSAGSLALLILVYPILLNSKGKPASHSALMLLMLGISAGFVHGVGFVPESPLWQRVFSPLVAWPLMLAGICMTLI